MSAFRQDEVPGLRLLDDVPLGVQLVEAAGERPEDLVLLWANAEAGRQSGFDLAALTPRRMVEVFPGPSEWLGRVFRACVEQAPREIELPYEDDRVGPGVWRARLRPLGGRRSLAVYENRTEDFARERALRASERLNRAIIDSLREGVMVWDPEGRIVQANAAASALVGVDDLLGLTPADLPIGVLGADGTPLAARELPQARALRGEPVRGSTVIVVRADGASRWIEIDSTPLVEAGAAGPYGAVCTYRDVSAQVERERRIRHEADHDALTGLANRRTLERTLTAAVARARGRDRRVAVLVLDLDGFKAINDRRGHAAGDEVLREVARRLRGAVRERDLVARVGGDEFVIVLTDAGDGPGAAADCRDRVAAALARPLLVAGEEVALSAAVGVAAGPDDGGDAAALLDRADRQMYAAKRRRR